MAIGSLLLGLALLIVVALFVARPLLVPHTTADAKISSRRQLEQEKEALLTEIRELDFDYETGKIPSEVYEPQRNHLLAQAAAVLQELDEITEDSNEELRQQIEAAVARRRRQPQPVLAGNGQGSYCTNCGRHLDQGDKFCASCGQPVRAVQPTI